MAARPLVAVTATTESLRGRSRVRVNEAYTWAIERTGMLPLVIPPLDDERAVADLIATVDGLLLTGGEDVDPALYGARPHPATEEPHAERDRAELLLLAAARDAQLPTLAICRGLQVANVALGGTLVQDIPSERRSAIDHAPAGKREQRTHEVHLETDSRLAVAVGASVISVNSSHHQALDRVAPGLTVSATAPDGIVEGAEWSGDWWLLGVQWHPEELVATEEGWDRSLFDAFRRAIDEHRAARERAS